MEQLNEKDWIIARLLYALYAEGRNADNTDAMKSSNWFIGIHGAAQLLDAYSQIAKEGRKIYEPHWKDKGKWSE